MTSQDPREPQSLKLTMLACSIAAIGMGAYLIYNGTTNGPAKTIWWGAGIAIFGIAMGVGSFAKNIPK